MNRLLIISGPTASGKTSLAFRLAKKFNGELVSADSRQIYRGMSIVTGKDIPKAKIKNKKSKLQVKSQKCGILRPIMFEEIPVWLLDIVDPDYNFNVSEYYEVAWGVIDDVWKRGKLPIVVGGTGFYIKALIDGIGTIGIGPDWKLRSQLETLTVEQLQNRLRKVNSKRWESMNESDRRNPRRLTRAIEVVKKKDSGQARMTSFWGGGTMTPESFIWIGLRAPSNIIYNRIDQRVDERLQMGAVEETKRLAKKYGWDIPSMTGQGYRELRDYIEGKIYIEEAINRWKFAEHGYARRQMTWFKKEKRIVWFDIIDLHFGTKVEEKVNQWYTNS